MELIVKDISNFLEGLAPLSSQESYDNCGLITGSHNQRVSGVLLSLDCTEAVVDEAISKGANMIVSHHPIVFKGLKKINGKNYVERTIIKAIKNDIAIYAIHTNLDNYRFGVNYEIANRIGLKNPKILAPKSDVLKKLIVFCPTENVSQLSKSLFEAGAGSIGDYAECSFESEGKGGFLPGENTNPTLGEVGNREEVKETKLEVIISSHIEGKVLSTMFDAHPYEEVAYDVIPLSNKNHFEGSGMIGELEKSVSVNDFLSHLKSTFNCGIIRHTDKHVEEIKKVAFCGGAGSFLLNHAKAQAADIFITGDFKYHEFFDAEDRIIIADIGHYESEQFTPNLIHDAMKKKFINFALHLSEVNTNPINYF